ncbi:hypothetical protein AB833_18400 [Chromatiales bacterium (ex Bugula neritina AB1)]|nr:hypothetical protein AB833_18400 [Chromatiales bacterium (ex Bugula neritina AB1)]
MPTAPFEFNSGVSLQRLMTETYKSTRTWQPLFIVDNQIHQKTTAKVDPKFEKRQMITSTKSST